jgi:hypothetical protein
VLEGKARILRREKWLLTGDFNIGFEVASSTRKQTDVEDTFSTTAASLYLRDFF